MARRRARVFSTWRTKACCSAGGRSNCTGSITRRRSSSVSWKRVTIRRPPRASSRNCATSTLRRARTTSRRRSRSGPPMAYLGAPAPLPDAADAAVATDPSDAPLWQPFESAVERRYRILDSVFRVRFSTMEQAEIVHAVLEHLATNETPQDSIAVDVVQSIATILVYRDRTWFGGCQDLRELAPIVKALVWQSAVNNHDYFLDSPRRRRRRRSQVRAVARGRGERQVDLDGRAGARRLPLLLGRSGAARGSHAVGVSRPARAVREVDRRGRVAGTVSDPAHAARPPARRWQARPLHAHSARAVPRREASTPRVRDRVPEVLAGRGDRR